MFLRPIFRQMLKADIIKARNVHASTLATQITTIFHVKVILKCDVTRMKYTPFEKERDEYELHDRGIMVETCMYIENFFNICIYEKYLFNLQQFYIKALISHMKP